MPKHNSAPLQSALRSVKQFTSALQELRDKKTALQTELKGSSAKIDPRDDAALDRLVGSRNKIAMLEALIPDEEQKSEPLVAALVREIEAFEGELRQAAAAERDQLLEKVSALVRPYCRDYTEVGARVDAARSVASRCTVFQFFSDRLGNLTLPSGHRSGNPARYDAEVVARAEELIAISKQVEKTGSFLPADFVAAA